MWEIRWGNVPLYVEEFRGRNGEQNRREKVYVYLPYSALFINPLQPELFFLILAHSVYKMCIIQEPNKLAL